MGLKCFLVKPAFRANRGLRRYSTRDVPCSVGKQWGTTCNAGGGSIATPRYHGFLGISGAAPGEFT